MADPIQCTSVSIEDLQYVIRQLHNMAACWDDAECMDHAAKTYATRAMMVGICNNAARVLQMQLPR